MPNRLLLIGLIFLFFSCGNEKIIQLPEVENTKITKVLDVSPAYIFYDETKQDSVELNRKNLIISTNWLFNVDKRLTLAQAIPKIKFLQDKKRNAKMHKNENARNYFTCNDTSINNLGFIDFTDVVYKEIKIEKDSSNVLPLHSKEVNRLNASYHASSTLSIFFNNNKSLRIGNEFINIENLSKKIQFLLKEYNFIGFQLELYFSNDLSFQDYITIKSKLAEMKLDSISFSDNEFIY